MKISKVVLPVLLALAAAAALPAEASVHLVRIAKGAPGLEATLASGRFDVAQEMRTCYLARLDREEIAALRAAGFPVALVDRDVAGKRYYLVRRDSDRTRAALSARGYVEEIEPGHLLFWAPSGDPEASIPEGVRRKPLPAASVAPYLKRYPVPASVRSDVPRNPLVAPIVAAVSRENLRAIIQALQDFGTRRTGTPGGAAAMRFVRNYFIGQGLPVREVPLPGGAGVGTVCGELTGTRFPDEIIVVCAHADSTSPMAETLAPGADDNASGTAAVMEAARILARRPAELTVHFAVFSGEEQGLDGSRAFAADIVASGRRVVGVVNLDMIAFADRMPEDLDVFVNPASEWLGRRIVLDAAEYAGMAASSRVDASLVYSDHASFWDIGAPALLGIEDEPLNNPHYHTTGDTLETLNLDFCAQAAKAALATAAGLAQPVGPGPAAPRGLTARSSFFSAILARRKSVYLRWETEDGVSGYNVYRTEVPHGFYEKVNTGPVDGGAFADSTAPSGKRYFYVVTAVDASGLEGNPSLEVEVPAVPPRES